MIITISQNSESTVSIAIAGSVNDTNFFFRIVRIFDFKNIWDTSLWNRSISNFGISVFGSNCLDFFITSNFDAFQSISTEQMSCSCFTSTSLTIKNVAKFDKLGEAKISFFKIPTEILYKLMSSFLLALIIRKSFWLRRHLS